MAKVNSEIFYWELPQSAGSITAQRAHRSDYQWGEEEQRFSLSQYVSTRDVTIFIPHMMSDRRFDLKALEPFIVVHGAHDEQSYLYRKEDYPKLAELYRMTPTALQINLDAAKQNLAGSSITEQFGSSMRPMYDVKKMGLPVTIDQLQQLPIAQVAVRRNWLGRNLIRDAISTLKC